VIKNITLSADELLIARARDEALRRGTTLNEEFRRWLVSYSEQDRAGTHYHDLMERLSYASPGDPPDIPDTRPAAGWEEDTVGE
jgi:hypothetical protein